MLQDFNIYNKSLSSLPEEGRLLINTINAHSYNVARKDAEFEAALKGSDVLLPDGISVVWAVRLLSRAKSKKQRAKTADNGQQTTLIESNTLKKIAGEDLFYWEMAKLEQRAKNKEQRAKNKEQRVKIKEQRQENTEAEVKAKAMFLGSTEEVLAKIKARAGVEYPHVEVYTYSPPYKASFSDEDNRAMYAAIETVQPDVLFVGMTAPKQEKWAYSLINNEQLLINNCHICCIGAVFDFYAGTVKRAPISWQRFGLEWLYRLLKEPRRMWRRYLIGNVLFICAVLKEKFIK